MNATSSQAETAVQSSIYRGVSGVRVKIILLVLIGCAHVVITLSTIVPGYLSIDEAIYHMMAKNFSETGGQAIWNGYEEFPSKELSSRFLRPHLGKLYSQYPYLFPVLAFPFYTWFGFFGLFLLNSVSFLGATVLCFATAWKLFRDLDLALNSCLVFIFATFAWEYSQAAWPHCVGLLFITASFYLFVCSYYASTRRVAIFLAFSAGLVAGIGTGVRMDVFLVLPSLILPFLAARPSRLLEPLMVAVGTLPGLILLAEANFVKCGLFSPFTYGSASDVPKAMLLGAVVLMVATWPLTRPNVVKWMRNRPSVMTALVLGIILLVAIVPHDRAVETRMIENAHVSLVDVRALAANERMPALGRSSGGGMIYIGGLKKSLLQSLPWLVILVVPLIRIARSDEDSVQICLLFLVPGSVVGFLSCCRHEFGGLCLNFRYFVLFMPFVAILCAYAIRNIRRRWGMPFSWFTVAVIVAVTASTYFLFTEELFVTINQLEFPLLVVPLIMACMLLGLLLLGELQQGGGLHLIRGAAWVLVIVAMTWSGVVAFSYDYPLHRLQRVKNFNAGALALKIIPRDSLFITFPYLDAFLRLIEADRVRIAFPARDRFKDMPKLVAYHLKEGRRVFAAFPRGVWASLKAGSLARYEIKPVWVFSTGFIGEILRKGP